MVVCSPCPVYTRVSAGRVSRCSRMESMITSKEEKLLPVAPGPPWNRVHACFRHIQATTARGVARGGNELQVRSRDAEALTVLNLLEGDIGVGLVPQHPVAGVQEDGSIVLLGKLRGDGDVVVVAVGADNAFHGAVANNLGNGVDGVGGVDDVDLCIVANNPNVVVYFPLAAVELKQAGGLRMLNSEDH